MDRVVTEVKKELSSSQWYSLQTFGVLKLVMTAYSVSLFTGLQSYLKERSSALCSAITRFTQCHEYNAMLSKWNIKKEKVHLIVKDNAGNMV